MVEGTLPGTNGSGIGLYVDVEAVVTASDIVLKGNQEQIFAIASEADLSRLVVVDSVGNDFGVGVISQDAAEVTLSSSVVRGNLSGGAALFTASLISTENLYEANSGSTFETDGLAVIDGSTLQSFGDVVLDHAGMGYLAVQTLASSDPNLITVRRGLVEGQSGIAGSLDWGIGFALNGGTGGQISDTVIRANHDIGVYVSDVSSSGSLPSAVNLANCRIEGTLPSQAHDGNGVALQALGDAQVSALQTLFLDSRGAGVHVAGASVALVECEVSGVEDNVVTLGDLGLASESGGDALMVQGTSLDGEPLSPEGFDTGLTVSDSWIDGAERAAILAHAAPATLSSTRFGGSVYGVVEQEGGDVTLDGTVEEDIDEPAPSETLSVP